MTTRSRLAPLSVLRLVTLVALAASAGVAIAQATAWDYKSYRKSKGGGYDKDEFRIARIAVTEKDGQAWFRMTAPNLGVCYGGDLPATVTRTAETTLIEVTRVVPGCEEFRYTIQNDGSGGMKETKMGERWVKSRFDHGLTPAK